MSAAGHYVQPLFVFPRVHMKAELLDRAPPGSIAIAHKSGWMQTELLVHWFKHFIDHAHPTSANPVLLMLDGHKTHTLNLDVINLARANHVTILCLPPHCTHRLQPLDVGLMKPLMTYYTQEIEKWMRRYPGRVVTLYQVQHIDKRNQMFQCGTKLYQTWGHHPKGGLCNLGRTWANAIHDA